MLFRTTSFCVHCQQGMALGFFQLLPDPFRFTVKVRCPHCHGMNRLPWYAGFTLMMVSVQLSLFGVVVAGQLLVRHGLWPTSGGGSVVVGSACAMAVLSVSAVLCVRCYVALVRQPFVVPRSDRTNQTKTKTKTKTKG